MIPLAWYLIVAAALFAIGVYGVLARRNMVAVLMSIELMLNAVNINLIAFWRYNSGTGSDVPTGMIWSIFLLTIAAAEAAVGLALVISIYRSRDSVVVDELDTLKY